MILNNYYQNFHLINQKYEKKKEAYPYEWVDSSQKFDHQELSLKERFYSSLKYGKRDNDNGHISDNQYLHLKMLWNTFNFNTFRDFHNHYLKKDLLLLADIFGKFIFTSLKIIIQIHVIILVPQGYLGKLC